MKQTTNTQNQNTKQTKKKQYVRKLIYNIKEKALNSKNIDNLI